MENTTQLLTKLNEIGPKWAGQFENEPELPMFFSLNDSGNLILNGDLVCPLEDVDISTIFIDAEFFGFYTVSGREVRFTVDWPFAEPPEILPWVTPCTTV